MPRLTQTDLQAMNAEERRLRPLPDRELADAETALLAQVGDPARRVVTLYGLARVRMARSDIPGARSRLEELFKLKSDFIPALSLLAYVEIWCFAPEAALAALDRIPTDRLTPPMELMAARCRDSCGDHEKAIEALERAVAKSWDGIKPVMMAALAGYVRTRVLAKASRPPDSSALEKLRRNPALAVSLIDYATWMARGHFQTLNNKAGLAELVSARDSAPPILPETFILPEQGAELRARMASSKVPWMVKLPNFYGGIGVRIIFDAEEADDSDRCVVLRYIDNPYLIDGRKCHLRIYLLVQSGTPARIRMWIDGIVRIAPAQYRRPMPRETDMSAHITNTRVFRDHPEMVLPNDSARDDVGNIWSLAALARHMRERHPGAPPLAEILEGFSHRLAGLIETGVDGRDSAGFFDAVIAADIVLDQELRPWLLEIESKPALDWGKVPLIHRIHHAMAAATIPFLLTPDQGDDGAQGWLRIDQNPNM